MNSYLQLFVSGIKPGQVSKTKLNKKKGQHAL